MNIYIVHRNSSAFEPITLAHSPFGSGGQADVYGVETSSYKADYCVKYFKKQKEVDPDRIQYMIDNPPNGIMSNPGFRICWPEAMAYDLSKQPVGYMMPLAFPDSRDLIILSKNKIKVPISKQYSKPKYAAWHNKYELNTSSGLENRLKMMVNWAIAMHCIHETNRYVICDIKPENVLATPTGKISIVDTDSFQIYENNRLLFKASAYTEDYLAPDAKPYIKNNQPIPQSCDCYSAAIVFYNILVGIHPFVGVVIKSPYDKSLDGTTACNMTNGFFAYGSKSRCFNIPMNSPHNSFNNLSKDIQKLFLQAFDINPKGRPIMEDFGKFFRMSVKSASRSTSKLTQPTHTIAPTVTPHQKPIHRAPQQNPFGQQLQPQGSAPQVPQSNPKSTGIDKKIILGAAGLIAVAIIVVGVLFVFKNDDNVGVPTNQTPTEIVKNTPSTSNSESQEETTAKVLTDRKITNTKPTKPAGTTSSSAALNYDYGTYKGAVKNSKADGKGRMTYNKRTLISKYDSKKRYAEAGQYVEGNWKNGKLNIGALYDSDGTKVETLMIGRVE